PAFLGVNGLVVADQYAPQARDLERHGWRRVTDVDGGTVWERGPAPAPRGRVVEECPQEGDGLGPARRPRREARPQHPPLGGESEYESGAGRLRFAPARVELLRDGRNAVEVEVANTSAEREALVVFLRPWFPGYRARLDGRPLGVAVVDRVLPAVRLPAGVR